MDNPSAATRADEIRNEIATVLAVPIHRHLGLRLVEAGGGRSRLEFTAGPAAQMAETGARVHGGILALLMEPAAFVATLDLLPAGKTAITADLHVSNMRPAPPGAVVTLVGRVVRPGTTLFFCEVEALADGKTVASARVTKVVVDAR